MLTLTLATLLGATADPEVEACAGREQVLSDHIADVCDVLEYGDIAYSTTMRASLFPQPAARQVIIYREDDEWFIRVAGYRWERGTSLVSTRRNVLPISAEDAARIEGLVNTETLARLAELPYYGSETVICTDGANFELALAVDGQRHSARQHSCAGETELSRISAVFREIALEYDADFEELLGGL